jgi:hypothetical protein
VFIDPNSRQPIAGFRPRTTTGSTSMGADRESISRELFGKRPTQLTSTEMAQVNERLKAFGGEKAGAVESGRSEAAAGAPLATPQRFADSQSLAKQWTEATVDRDKMRQQYSLMQTGLARYKADPIGGSQAVLVTFQKILDPPSVVRESEYARSPQGLAAKDWLQGMYDKYITGGAGVPEPILAEMVKTAEAFVTDANLKTGLENIKTRLHGTATRYEIDVNDVFGPADLPVGRPSAAVGAPPPGAPGKSELDNPAPGVFMDGQGNIIRR